MVAYGGVAGSSQGGDRAGIERLHRLDVETTLTDKADELARLWDKDAVRRGEHVTNNKGASQSAAE